MRAGLRGVPFIPLQLGTGVAQIDAPETQREPVERPDEQGVECLSADDDQYSTDWRSACVRVLCWNPPRVGPRESTKRERIESMRKKFSFLGPTGHLERSSAWLHLFGTVLFLVFASARPATELDSVSLAGQISTATSFVVATTFLVSTGFHTLGTVRWLAPAMRTLDHGAIDVALALASTADLAVVTLDFSNSVPWQTVADALGVAAVILVFFIYRRIVLPASATELAWGDCALGLFRLQHADFEHSALRSASYVVLSFGFLTVIPVAFANLTTFAAVSLVVANGTALLLLIAGLLLDNVWMFPDVMYNAATKSSQTPWLVCHSTKCGCILTSHAAWHVFTLVSVVLQTVGREIAISETVRVK